MAIIDFRDAYKIIRPSIVGLGLRDDPQYQILGSGFIVHESGWILTNAHVIEALLENKRNQATKLKKGAAAFLFFEAQPRNGFDNVGGMLVVNIIQASCPLPSNPSDSDPYKSYEGLKPSQIIPSSAPDIGVCQIDPSQVLQEALPLIPAKIVSSVDVEEGLPVGILGFPQGISFPIRFDSSSSLQITPLLQTGVISGILPFAQVSSPVSFALDIFVNHGSSGSPLFSSDGSVIGVVYATRQSFQILHTLDKDGNLKPADDKGVFVGSALCLAVPSSRFPQEWISKP